MKKSWYSISNTAPDFAEICIYDNIGAWGITAAQFISDLKSAGEKPITLRLNSGGGDVFDGIAIYNRLREHKPGVTVMIDSLAASIASVIAMAGTKIIMPENAWLMIHNPTGVAAGESTDMRELADLLDRVKGSLVSAYQPRMKGKSAEEIAALMDAESWFNGSEACAAGLADEVTSPMKMAASFDTSKFRNAPKAPTNQAMNLLRTSILAALNLTDPEGGQPITDAEIANFVERAASAEKTVVTLTADLDTARKSYTDAQAKLTAAELKASQLAVITGDVKTALALTDEQVTNLVSDRTVIATAVQAAAMKKATDIAASQGVPPVPTKPGAATGNEDIKAAFSAAAEETDPRKRGALYAAASAQLAKSKTHGRN